MSNDEYKDISQLLSEERSTPPAERRRAFSILFLSLIAQGAGQTLLFAILPPLSRDLGMSEIQVTTIFAVSSGCWIFGSPFWGARSDHWGRKPVMITGLIAFAVSMLIFATALQAGVNQWLSLAIVFPLMILARATHGLIGSGTFPAAQAYVADRTSREERAGGIATVSAAFGVGNMIGPGIATLLAALSMIAPFYVISGIALGAAFAIWKFLPERTRPIARRSKARMKLKWYDSRVFPYVCFIFGIGLASSVPLQTVGFYFMDTLHLQGAIAMQFIMIGQMSSAMASLFAQLVIVQRAGLSVRQLARYGIILAFVAMLVFTIGAYFGALVFAMILSGLGFSMARPAFTAAASLAVTPQEQGSIAGILSGASAAGYMLAPLTGLVYQISPYLPYGVAAGIMAILFVFMHVSRRLRKAGEITPDPEVLEETPSSASNG